jgi:hypothetical protein
MEVNTWVAISALIVSVLRIFKYHLLVIIVNNCKHLKGIIIKTKISETKILKNDYDNLESDPLFLKD